MAVEILDDSQIWVLTIRADQEGYEDTHIHLTKEGADPGSPLTAASSGIDPNAGHRTLDLMRWGLVPYWAKDIKIGFSTINAMAETIDTKSVFREAFQRGRCIVPVDSF